MAILLAYPIFLVLIAGVGFDDPAAGDLLGWLRPLLLDAVGLVQRLAELVGARPHEQLRQLELVESDLDVLGWYRQKLLVAGVYVGLAFTLNLLAGFGGAWH